MDHERLSRAASHALRHEPWLYELELDDEGWYVTASLLAALRSTEPSWSSLGETDLAAMIATSSKARYEIQGGRIRALYGHSLPGKLRKEKANPPVRLFHGTSPAALTQIKASGLRPMNRQYVHLSMEPEMAVAVGKRKSPQPIVLIVRSEAANAAGHSFYIGNDKVWLADEVPAAFIDFG